MRISDWSSDVCSSDLGPGQREQVNWGRWIVSVFRTGAAGLFATTALLASASAHAQVAAPNAGDASVAETRMSSSTATAQATTLAADVGQDATDIVVTARRLDERLQAVPASVRAFSPEAMEHRPTQPLPDIKP